MFQIVGGKKSSWHGNSNSNDSFDSYQEEECDWVDLDADLYYWTKSLRPVQVLY